MRPTALYDSIATTFFDGPIKSFYLGWFCLRKGAVREAKPGKLTAGRQEGPVMPLAIWNPRSS